jgi:uncharacterized protein (TIGR03066 family)
MNRLYAFLLMFVFVLGLAGCDKGTASTGNTTRRGDTNKDVSAYKENIIGTWELMTQEKIGAPVGTLFEFTRDGKVFVTAKNTSKKAENGSYEVSGDTLKQTFKKGSTDLTITSQIKTLTSQDLVIIKDDKKEEMFKKK